MDLRSCATSVRVLLAQSIALRRRELRNFHAVVSAADAQFVTLATAHVLKPFVAAAPTVNAVAFAHMSLLGTGAHKDAQDQLRTKAPVALKEVPD